MGAICKNLAFNSINDDYNSYGVMASLGGDLHMLLV